MRTIDNTELNSPSAKREGELATKIMHELIDEFMDRVGYFPSRLFVNRNHELQSLIMLAGWEYGLEIKLTDRRTYVE